MLRKRTQRVIKIYKLFEKIGVDKIKNIKSYSMDSISKFTMPQIQIILNYFSGSYVKLKKPNSYSESKNIEKVRPKVSLEKRQGSVPKKLPDVRISTPPISQTSKINQINIRAQSKPTYDRSYFCSKALDQYSNLYREFSSENFDYYRITDEISCPLCKLDHDDEESIKGRYKTRSYFIKCEQREIEIVA